MENNITAALQECQGYAQKGYDIAMKSWNELHMALMEEEKKISAADAQQRQMKRLENNAILARQKRNLNDFEKMDRELKQDLNNLHKQQKEFSVLVFGRTMVGKSTLMEILTHGNGASIGNGSQRTTLDVRDYHWQGMKITDVPGIASFDGDEDDRLALDAAKAADLILFLISDDGVQQEEAKNLAELRRLGKPVLGLINVKLGITDNVRPLDLKRLAKKMSETERINAICDQFRQFSSSYQQDWGDLTFVPTHLKAAYIGQDKHPELWDLSNFAAVEQYILDKVQRDGCFLRIKTFIDMAVLPLQKRMEMLFKNSGENIKVAFEYRRKWHDLDDWREEFFEETKEKYQDLCDRVYNRLNNGIRDFAAVNYENQNAGKAWKKYLQDNLQLEQLCAAFLQEREAKCARKRRELCDSLQTELSFMSLDADFGHIHMDDITDTQFIGGLASIGAAIVFGGPIGLGLGIINRLFGDSKAEKIRKAKKELADKLTEVTEPYADTLLDNVIDNLNEKIFGQAVGGLRDILVQKDELFFTLAGREAAAGEGLQDMLQAMNRRMWSEADRYLQIRQENAPISHMVRMPGEFVQIYAQAGCDEDYLESMNRLLGEKVIWTEVDDNEDLFNHIFAALTELIGDWEFEDFEYGEEGKINCMLLQEKSLAELEDDARSSLAYQYISAPITEL